MKSIFYVFAVPVICAALFCGSRNLHADIVWNEAVNGDLSSIPASPTPLIFINGSNTVIGSLSEPAGDLRDYMTFTIGPNQFLTGLILDTFTPDGVSFHAINSGSTSFIPGDAPSENFLGLELVFHTAVGTDLLPDLAAGAFGSLGFTIPLGPGTYSYLMQEVTAGQSRSYQISFNVIPEPTSAGLLCLVGLLSINRRRRS